MSAIAEAMQSVCMVLTITFAADMPLCHGAGMLRWRLRLQRCGQSFCTRSRKTSACSWQLAKEKEERERAERQVTLIKQASVHLPHPSAVVMR